MNAEKELFAVLKRQFVVNSARKCFFLFCLVICCLYFNFLRQGISFQLDNIFFNDVFILLLIPVFVFFFFEYQQYRRALKRAREITQSFTAQQRAQLLEQMKEQKNTRSCYSQVTYIGDVAVIYNCLSVSRLVELKDVTSIKQSQRFHPPWKGNWKSYLLCIKVNGLGIRILLSSINECEDFIQKVKIHNPELV